MYKTLRHLRIAVSLIFALFIALICIDSAMELTPIGKLVVRLQLVPAILAGSTMWIVVWVVITISFGRVYCSTVCPLGTLMDVAAHCGRATAHGAGKRYRYMPPRNKVRFLLPTIVAASLCFGFTLLAKYTDPTFLYHRLVVAIARPLAIGAGSLAGGFLVLLIVSVASWKHGRLLCNLFCPAGGLLGLLGRTSIYRVDINTDLCTHCGKCEDVCKAGCINLQDCTVDNSRCVMCQNCTAICPNQAIIIRRGRYTLSTPMMQRTAPMRLGHSTNGDATGAAPAQPKCCKRPQEPKA